MNKAYGLGAILLAVVGLLIVVGLRIGPVEAKEHPSLTDDTYDVYRVRIGPQPSDKAWQQIDWLPSYREGLEAAAKQQKPILLWVMNGHPLGCT